VPTPGIEPPAPAKEGTVQHAPASILTRGRRQRATTAYNRPASSNTDRHLRRVVSVAYGLMAVIAVMTVAAIALVVAR
jgi:hypothetical protein